MQGNRSNPAGLACPPRRGARTGTLPQCARPILNPLGLRVHLGKTCSYGGGKMSFSRQEANLTPCSEAHLRDECIAGYERSAEGLTVARARTDANNGSLSPSRSNREAGNHLVYDTPSPSPGPFPPCR